MPCKEPWVASFQPVEPGQARGRVYSRNPASGSARTSGEVYLAGNQSSLPLRALEKSFPRAAQQLRGRLTELEGELKDAVELEFEIGEERLTVVSYQALSRSPSAAFKVVTDLVEEGVLSREEALNRIEADQLGAILLPRFEPVEVLQARRQGRVLARGRGYGGGATSGFLVLDEESARRLQDRGLRTVLVCERLSYRHRDLLPVVGAVVVKEGPVLGALQYERPCLALPELAVEAGEVRLGEHRLNSGEPISVNALEGELYAGALSTVPGELSFEAHTLLEWAGQVGKAEIRANVGSVESLATASAFGAGGVGLFRIEPLFLHPQRLECFQLAFREICEGGLSDSGSISRLREAVEADLLALFQQVNGPFNVRLLDAPTAQMLRDWRNRGSLPADFFEGELGLWLDELSPMQGLRCGRLSLLYPALMRLQLEAILNARTQIQGEFRLQIMMPGVADPKELRAFRERVERMVQDRGIERPELGTMLETPRACLMAGELARDADFFSFGTGDLTEATFALSRYDGPFHLIPGLTQSDLLTADPFTRLDRFGVGALMRMALEAIKSRKPTAEVGICGAQAVEPSSFEFCCRLGLDYVSVPARHVPVARLLAAQSALTGRGQTM